LTLDSALKQSHLYDIADSDLRSGVGD